MRKKIMNRLTSNSDGTPRIYITIDDLMPIIVAASIFVFVIGLVVLWFW